MTTDTMRRVRQKQRADRMLPAHSFQKQRLSRFLPAPKSRSRTSDEWRDVRTVGDVLRASGVKEVWAREIEKMSKGLRPAFPPSWVERLRRAVEDDQRVREANEMIVKARETMGDDAVGAVLDSVVRQAEPRQCPYHVDQKCQADCWYRNPVARGHGEEDDEH